MPSTTTATIISNSPTTGTMPSTPPPPYGSGFMCGFYGYSLQGGAVGGGCSGLG